VSRCSASMPKGDVEEIPIRGETAFRFVVLRVVRGEELTMVS
jgi:hypothetical protein